VPGFLLVLKLETPPVKAGFALALGGDCTGIFFDAFVVLRGFRLTSIACP